MNPPDNLPPATRTDDNDFAHTAMYVRAPEAIQRVIDTNPGYSGTIRRALQSLSDRLVFNEPITMLEPLAPDYSHWLPLFERHRGATWLAVEWFYAETFFYRHLIQAVRWWETQRDPFASIKEEELRSPALWEMVEAQPGSLDQRLHNALWGNRIDLSFAASLSRGTRVDQDDLLVDDTGRVVEHLAAGAGTVHIIADNTGTELAMDLLLADALLAGRITHVVVHLKMHPTFISDAVVADVWNLIDRLDQHNARLAERLRTRINEGRLRLLPDFFWNSGYFLWELPAHLERAMNNARLVIVKGDANYRRILGDALWPSNTSFTDATHYFPAPLLALRTLKSDPIVGLAPGQVETLDSIDREWRVNGQRGVLQFKGVNS
jgi:hypothetical protein